MAIPPGPQIPFDPNRKYGQGPGFVSRNSGKIFIGILIVILLLIAFFSLTVLTALNPGGDDFAALTNSAAIKSGRL